MSHKTKIFAAATAVFMLAVHALCGCSSSPSPDIAPHLITTPDASPVRPIYSAESENMSAFDGELTETQYRARIGELYSIVVDDRKQPVFYGESDPVKPVYDAAIDVLNRYILNAWRDTDACELNIAHTLHDYLATEVKYDFDLYERYVRGENIADDPAFGIDGVFLNKVAVCDGLSRAFAFLCAIEDVDCVRVTGTFDGVSHAWNKVKLNDDWYNVDVTGDTANYLVNGGTYRSQLSHGFFLISDNTLRTFRPRPHEPIVIDYPAVHDYDYYSGKTLLVGDAQYPHVITDQNMLNALFSDISKQKGKVGKIELRLKFPNKTNVNYGDMYEAEIAEAYGKLKNPDFVLNSTQKPYFQYPNGVYLFLMYQ